MNFFFLVVDDIKEGQVRQVMQVLPFQKDPLVFGRETPIADKEKYESRFVEVFLNEDKNYQTHSSWQRSVFNILHADYSLNSNKRIEISPSTKTLNAQCEFAISGSSGSSEEEEEEIINIEERHPTKRRIRKSTHYQSSDDRKSLKYWRTDNVYYFKKKAVTFMEAKGKGSSGIRDLAETLAQCLCYAVPEILNGPQNCYLCILLYPDRILLMLLQPSKKRSVLTFTYKMPFFDIEGTKEEKTIKLRNFFRLYQILVSSIEGMRD